MLAAAAVVGWPAIEETGGGGGGGVVGAMLLELPAVMEKCGAPQRAAMIVAAPPKLIRLKCANHHRNGN